jgi:hypothetical protein
MTEEAQDAADTLLHAGLIAGSGECKGLLTFAGSDRLTDWNERFPTGGVA